MQPRCLALAPAERCASSLMCTTTSDALMVLFLKILSLRAIHRCHAIRSVSESMPFLGCFGRPLRLDQAVGDLLRGFPVVGSEEEGRPHKTPPPPPIATWKNNETSAWSSVAPAWRESASTIRCTDEEQRHVRAELGSASLVRLHLNRPPRLQPHHPSVVDVRTPRCEQLGGRRATASTSHYEAHLCLSRHFTILCSRPRLPAAGNQSRWAHRSISMLRIIRWRHGEGFGSRWR